jgi:hypothetical protein
MENQHAQTQTSSAPEQSIKVDYSRKKLLWLTLPTGWFILVIITYTLASFLEILMLSAAPGEESY